MERKQTQNEVSIVAHIQWLLIDYHSHFPSKKQWLHTAWMYSDKIFKVLLFYRPCETSLYCGPTLSSGHPHTQRSIILPHNIYSGGLPWTMLWHSLSNTAKFVHKKTIPWYPLTVLFVLLPIPHQRWPSDRVNNWSTLIPVLHHTPDNSCLLLQGLFTNTLGKSSYCNVNCQYL